VSCSVLSEAEKLEEGHPDAALAHMGLGSVYYHRQDYQMAFRAFVFAMVLREKAPVLGTMVRAACEHFVPPQPPWHLRWSWP